MKWAAVRALQDLLAFRRICSVARIRGLENLSCLDTWGFARKASRSTPGFMLTPAPQAKTDFSGKASNW